MPQMKKRVPELTRLFKRVSVRDLASGLGITSAAVYAWPEVPLDRIADVERLSGIPREQLRPDIYKYKKSKIRTPLRGLA